MRIGIERSCSVSATCRSGYSDGCPCRELARFMVVADQTDHVCARPTMTAVQHPPDFFAAGEESVSFKSISSVGRAASMVRKIAAAVVFDVESGRDAKN